MANALYRFWITKQRFEEGAAGSIEPSHRPAATTRLRGQAFINAGFMPFWMGQDERAAELFTRRPRDRPANSGTHR